MCVACRYQQCHQKFGTPKNMTPIIRRLKQKGLRWDDLAQRKRTQVESQHDHQTRKSRDASDETEDGSFDKNKDLECSLKPTIGKPALWSVATSTATTTLVKRVPMILDKMVHPPHKGSIRVPCGSIGNSGDRTAVLTPGGMGCKPGK